jgi:hypothetical protein
MVVVLDACKGNLTIRVQRLDTCKGKPKCKITKLKQKKDLHLARENQREFSKAPLARPQTMYKSCVTM